MCLLKSSYISFRTCWIYLKFRFPLPLTQGTGKTSTMWSGWHTESHSSSHGEEEAVLRCPSASLFSGKPKRDYVTGTRWLRARLKRAKLQISITPKQLTLSFQRFSEGPFQEDHKKTTPHRTPH